MAYFRFPRNPEVRIPFERQITHISYFWLWGALGRCPCHRESGWVHWDLYISLSSGEKNL